MISFLLKAHADFKLQDQMAKNPTAVLDVRFQRVFAAAFLMFDPSIV